MNLEKWKRWTMIGRNKITWLIATGAAGAVLLLIALLTGSLWWLTPPLIGGAVAAVLMVRRRAGKVEMPVACAPVVARIDPTKRPPVDPEDADSMVREMAAQGRYSLLLRPKVAGTLTPDQVRASHLELNEHMALVPSGEVVLGAIDEALDDGRLDDEEIDTLGGRVIAVQAYYLDRYPVTNRQYLEFLVAGGYEQMALWDEKILAALLDFVDTTGAPGPRFWNHGRYESGTDEHPVVGVSWYEAAAYARWAGKRLPSDAEWVKAGAWPVMLSDTARLQRKYPWGEAMDRRRANTWASGRGRIVPVTEFADGVSVGGIHQLIGNVWEWTTANLGSRASQPYLSLPTPMKSIRGGAFDTYFETQATCQFQSGENPIARKHNIGFRCALGVCDVVSPLDAEKTDVETSETWKQDEPQEVLV